MPGHDAPSRIDEAIGSSPRRRAAAPSLAAGSRSSRTARCRSAEQGDAVRAHGPVDAILIERRTGFGKPDPRIYVQALRELGVNPTDAWMVGDHLEWDVAQPQKMGRRGIWVDVRGAGLPDATMIRPDRVLKRLSELREECFRWAGFSVFAGAS
jgi:beta-phosphoglucomutase-like phosphatase (HAD superfamily)